MEHLLRDREQEDRGNLLTRLGNGLAEIGLTGLSHVVPFVSNALREMPTFQDAPGVGLNIDQPKTSLKLETSRKQIETESLEILNRTKNSLASWSTTYNAPIKLNKARATKPQATTRNTKTIESRLFFQEKWTREHLAEVRGLDDIFPEQVSGFFEDSDSTSSRKRTSRAQAFDKTLVAAGRKKAETEQDASGTDARKADESRLKADKMPVGRPSKKDFSHYPRHFAPNVLKQVPETFPRKPELIIAESDSLTEIPTVREMKVLPLEDGVVFSLETEIEPAAEIQDITVSAVEAPQMEITVPEEGIESVTSVEPETEAMQTDIASEASAELETVADIEDVRSQSPVDTMAEIEGTQPETRVEMLEPGSVVIKFESRQLPKILPAQKISAEKAPVLPAPQPKQQAPEKAMPDEMNTYSMLLRNNRRLSQSIQALTEGYFAKAALEDEGELYI